MNTIIDNLNWRYATKKFDSSKKINDNDLDTLMEVLRLAPSAYGLQPLRFLVIENAAIREQLKTKSYGQSQITDSSHLIVLCSYIDINDSHIDEHITNTAMTRGIDAGLLTGYGDYMKGSIKKIESEQILVWNSNQAYLALGQLILAAAQMHIDASPMEGFDASGYDEILNLKKQNLHAAVVCAIGYRSEEDGTQHNKKVRKSKSNLFELI
jgi:nitroreductase